MLSFQINQTIFMARTAGVVVRDGHVLLQRLAGESFWFTPGGRIEADETSAEGLMREMREELNAVVEPVRLLWVVEHFFIDQWLKRFHELGFYWLMTFQPDSPWNVIEGVRHIEVDGHAMEYAWHPIADLGALTVYPEFLPDGLKDLPTSTEHIMMRRRAPEAGEAP